MNSSNKKVLIIVFLCSILLLVILFILNSLSEFNQDFATIKHGTTNNNVDILKIITVDSKGNKIIPPNIYLSSDNWKTVSALENDISALNAHYSDSFANYEMIVNALTIEAKALNCHTLDLLYDRLSWAEDLRTVSNVSSPNHIVYSAVSGFWLDYITNKLSELNKENNSIKYEYRFRYLKTRLSNFDYYIGQGNSNFEKVILYVVDNKWTYLMNRFYMGTSLILKILVAFGFALTAYAYLCLVQKLYLKK